MVKQVDVDRKYLESVASGLLGEKHVLVNSTMVETIVDYIAKTNQTKQDDLTLKSYFETGDTPSEVEFADLIDSKLSRGEAYLKGEVYTRHQIDEMIETLIDVKAGEIQYDLEKKINAKIVDEINKKTADLEADIKQMGEDIYIESVKKTEELLVKFEKDFNERISVMVKKIIEEEYGIFVL